MLAAIVDSSGQISIAEVNRPAPKLGEALISVRAAGVNRADLLQRKGNYPPPPGVSPVLGLEISGVVEEDRSGRFQPGAEIYGLLSGGGYAEYVTADSRLLWEKPAQWSFEYAAALPEGLVTAFLNLVLEGELALGERVFVEGGSSGVGTFAIQVAKSFGAHVTASAGSPERVARLIELGADQGINHNTPEELPEPVDLILSIAGGMNLRRNLEILRPKGRLVIIAAQGGSRAELNVADLMRKRLRVIGSVLRSRSDEEKIQIKGRLDQSIGRSVSDGEIKPVIDSIFPLEQVSLAHERMERGEHFGKIILKVGGV
jgi:putative PIG3 family NAD(P)H quinone oxidoreductase